MTAKRVVLSRAVLRRMEREADRDFPHESGGILIGHVDDETVVVKALSTSGPKARSGPGSFLRDGDRAQDTLYSAVASSRGRDDYLGEWHSHPANVGASPRDRSSMVEVSRDPNYRRSRPVLIVLRRSDDAWTPDAHQLVSRRLLHLEVEITGR